MKSKLHACRTMQEPAIQGLYEAGEKGQKEISERYVIPGMADLGQNMRLSRRGTCPDRLFPACSRYRQAKCGCVEAS